MKRVWLRDYSWEFVTAQNAMLCEAKNALHQPTSDGHESTRGLWQENHLREMTLTEAVELCRRCHRGAPFRLGLPEEQTVVARSLAGHIVAGVATAEEERAFREFCAGLER